VRMVTVDEEDNRSDSSLGRHRSFLLVCLAVAILLVLAAQETTWAGPALHGLRDTIPTMTPTEDPNATPTLHPSATPTATLAPGVRQIILQQGVAGYEGTSDTYLDFGQQSLNHGSDNWLEVHSDGTRVSLLRFDLSGVPADITLLRADVQLHAIDWTASRTATARVHRVLRDWMYEEATWANATASALWFFPGCSGLGTDRAVVPETTEILAGISYKYSFEVTDAVAGWLAHPGSNYGLLMAADATSSVGYTFASGNHQTLDYRPALVITYVEGAITPTVTPTGVPMYTPTPTSTPLSMVFQYGVSPEIAPGIEYEGVSDTYIDAWHKTINYGEGWKLKLRSGDVEAALIRFDLSFLPPGAYVVDAELGVYVIARSNTTNLPASTYRVLRPWVDTEATWEQATGDDAWDVAGCNDPVTDRVEAPDDSQVLGSKGISDWWYYFDVSDMVSHWVAHPEANAGLILKAGESASVEYKLAASDCPGGESDHRPKLRVRYYLLAATPTATATATETPEGEVSGVVWNDTDGNGLMGEGEPALLDVEVALKDDGGAPLEQCLTDVDGYYAFSDLASTWYRVCVLYPSAYEPTTPHEVRVWPGSGVITRVNFGIREISESHTIFLPMVVK